MNYVVLCAVSEDGLRERQKSVCKIISKDPWYYAKDRAEQMFDLYATSEDKEYFSSATDYAGVIYGLRYNDATRPAGIHKNTIVSYWDMMLLGNTYIFTLDTFKKHFDDDLIHDVDKANAAGEFKDASTLVQFALDAILA